MQSFSVERTGFAALTILELLVQELVIKGVLSEREVMRVFNAAARRHDDAADADADKTEINVEAAQLIRALSRGLEPLLDREKELKKVIKAKAHKKAVSYKKQKLKKKSKKKPIRRAVGISG